jgi:hypothetical protein
MGTKQMEAEAEAGEESAASETRVATRKEPLEPPPGQILATTLTGAARILGGQEEELGIATAALAASSIVACLLALFASSPSPLSSPGGR